MLELKFKKEIELLSMIRDLQKKRAEMDKLLQEIHGELNMRIDRQDQKDNSERTMPSKSMEGGNSRELSDAEHDKYFPSNPKRMKK